MNLGFLITDFSPPRVTTIVFYTIVTHILTIEHQVTTLSTTKLEKFVAIMVKLQKSYLIICQIKKNGKL